MAELPDDIARINALTTNARNTWFALLGVLVFVGITLMGVEHIDFYGVDRDTTLPLVNVDVPTRYFFLAAPILTAAIYGYFHLYLIRLWDTLGQANARYETRPLGDVITPWLVTDAALHLRQRFRQDDCTTPRTMEFPAMLLNFLLAWGFGLVVLTLIWWQSMPARSFLLTGIAAVALVACLACGYVSWRAMILRMKPHNGLKILAADEALSTIIPTFVFYLVISLSLFRTEEPQQGIPLAPLIMIDEELVERPDGWLPYPVARAEFRAAWCEREKQKDCTDFKDREAGFAKEWQARRKAALSDMRRPDWHKSSRDKPDLRGALMARAFLSGADLSWAKMDGAILSGAQMEGAILSEAQMEGADLSGAQMKGAILYGAQMKGANLREAQMEGAILSAAQMDGTDLSGAQMEGAILYGTQMEGAILYGAQMEGANLFGAQMDRANLSGAQMEGTNLSGAQMEGAILSTAQIGGQHANRETFSNTNLRAGINNGGALRLVNLDTIEFDSKTDFRNVFLDASVTYTAAFARQMGGDKSKPCQWIDRELSDQEFYAHWRWWVEANPQEDFTNIWRHIAPEKWRDVPLPDSPPENCYWQTSPMPE